MAETTEPTDGIDPQTHHGERPFGAPGGAVFTARRRAMSTTKHAEEWLSAGKLRLPIQVLVALLLAATIGGQGSPAEPSLQGQGTLKVMTYNMYVGTGYSGLTDPDYGSFLQAATNVVLEVRASDPEGRAQAIGRQIAATMPHLVSLQEVATLSTGPTKENLTVEFDSLQLLLDGLAGLGVQYTPVASITHWDATVPGTLGFLRGTWRVVIIARADLQLEDFSYANVQAATWAPTLTVPLPALDGRADECPVALRPSDGACRMPFRRGWVSADVKYRGKQFRIVGAHLDSASHLLEIPQGVELLNGPANTSLPVVVAADLNADCSNPGDPTYATCENFRIAGFIDAWTAANPYEPGYTKHLPTLTLRSDYVMVRGRYGVQSAVLVGEEAGDMTAGGLWPSDHCGVVARLRLAVE
jgi:endonuclease/exonuclease/phosphatase family metal-dependent hydrolase